ncbi:MAG: helix-hairpin-helix domain-containing protein [Lewinellaceae bacterium]|nr:helix-hairpin-helix domain-containing protein [Phaeodactylibacter sp.]MCB9350740.1 helix-hairpin-helix domain-containing protein [Lewinellaceae bacterium]
MKRLFLILSPFLSLPALAQVDSLPQPPDAPQQVIEDFLQNTESEGDFDFNTVFEDLEYYLRRPLNLNEAGEEDLQNLQLLSDIQILELLNYRRTAGDLISIYELQAIPSFDLQTIRRLLPYVTVDKGIDDYQLSIPRMMAEGQNELYLRWSRIVEEQKGYSPLEEGQTAQRYLGDPNQFYLRYKHSYSNKLSYGLTAEKDRGEEFFTGSNKQGFDFYSAHLFIKDYNRTIKAIAIGDYAVSFGQGLILYSGFGAGKSSYVMNIKRTARVLRPYTSVNESNFQRGAAATLGFGEHLEVTALASYRRRDGNVLEPDTLDVEESIRQISSLGIAGLHRTDSEIADERALGQTTFGGRLRWKGDRGHIALNGLYEQIDADLTLRDQPYNRFYFSGDRLFNASLDYSFTFQNYNFFGETAMSDNGAIATLNGLLMGLDRKVDLAVLVRHFPRDYQALFPTPFAETTGARNETGAYLGLEVRPHRYWKLSAYFDAWKHPWLRFDADAPSRGYEYRARLTYFRKRNLEVYLEVRDETKERNIDKIEGKNNFTLPTRVFQTRLHLAKKVNKALELRSRIDVGFSENEINTTQRGFVIYQDVIFKPIGFPLSFTTRFALFDTDGFQARYYSFENNLLYAFSIPAYYNRGTRFYINLRYKGIRNLTLEARLAQTYWRNQDSIGSGLEEVAGPRRTELGAQVKYRF